MQQLSQTFRYCGCTLHVLYPVEVEFDQAGDYQTMCPSHGGTPIRFGPLVSAWELQHPDNKPVYRRGKPAHSKKVSEQPKQRARVAA